MFSSYSKPVAVGLPYFQIFIAFVIQVLFPDIPDTYHPKQDIRVSYMINDELTTSSRDWVGLFKVGWTTPREYITFVWSPAPSDDNMSAATFTGYNFTDYN